MANSLESLVAEGILDDEITRLKSGKEADVYMVRYGGRLVAAKVYKDRAHRSFKNNAVYTEGRTVRSSRSQRAIDKGSKFGKEAAENAWKATEAATLYKLHAAGVRVPTPVLFLEGVLLMEVVLGPEGDVAPRLIDVDLTPEEAHAAYLDMLSQLVRILSCDLIHGDLSPYNVLWAASGPTIIDFPQAVSAAHNNSSERLFLRDAENILGHFVARAPSLRSRSGDAREIWRAYVRRELTPDFMPTGKASFAPAPSHPRPPRQEHGGTSNRGNDGPPQKPNDAHRHGPRPERDPRHNRGAHQPQRDPRYNRGAQQQPQRDPRYNRGTQQPPQRDGHGQRQQPGPRQQHGQGGHHHPEQGQRGPRQRQGPGGNPRPRAPEIIVLNRPRRADAPAPASNTDRPHAPADAHSRDESSKPNRRRQHRP